MNTTDPQDHTYEVHAPETIDQQGYAYSPVVGSVDAPDIATAVEIANQEYGDSHALGEGGDGFVVYPSH